MFSLKASFLKESEVEGALNAVEQKGRKEVVSKSRNKFAMLIILFKNQ